MASSIIEVEVGGFFLKVFGRMDGNEEEEEES